MSDKFSAQTPKDCNDEPSSEKAPPLSRNSLPLTPVSASTSTPQTPLPPTTPTTTPITTSSANKNIIIREHLVEPKDDFILYDSDGGEDFSLFTDYSDYCGPIGIEGMGYPGEYKNFPEYGQIQVGKPNNEKS